MARIDPLRKFRYRLVMIGETTIDAVDYSEAPSRRTCASFPG